MDPTTIGPGMPGPLNIVPQPMQAAMNQPVGVLNGQQAPQQGSNSALMQQAMQLMKGPQQQQPPQMQPIQMARPVGSQGIDPLKLLAAMKQNGLMAG